MYLFQYMSIFFYAWYLPVVVVAVTVVVVSAAEIVSKWRYKNSHINALSYKTLSLVDVVINWRSDDVFFYYIHSTIWNIYPCLYRPVVVVVSAAVVVVVSAAEILSKWRYKEFIYLIIKVNYRRYIIILF